MIDRNEGERCRAALAALLAQGREALRALHGVASAFFAEESAGKEYQRRPRLSITLALGGDPPRRLSLTPDFVRERLHGPGRVDAATVRAEVLRLGQKGIRGLEVRVKLDARGASATGYSLRHAEDGLRALLDAAEDFLGDPAAVFARSSDNCSICGRGLTDEVSRSRGIGPECFRLVNAIFHRVPVAWVLRPEGVEDFTCSILPEDLAASGALAPDAVGHWLFFLANGPTTPPLVAAWREEGRGLRMRVLGEADSRVASGSESADAAAEDLAGVPTFPLPRLADLPMLGAMLLEASYALADWYDERGDGEAAALARGPAPVAAGSAGEAP